MKLSRLALSIMLILLLGTAVIHAAITDYDDSFGTNGIVITDGTWSATKATLQNDGKIIVASGQGAFLRYLPDGTLDDSFGTMGIFITEISADWKNTLYILDLIIDDVIVLNSGKLLAVGYTTDGDFDMNTPDIIAIRYLSNGSIDTTFGYNGIVRIHISGNDRAYAVAETEEGKLVMVGESTVPFGVPSPVVLRLLEDGTLDTTFGTNGATQTIIGALGNSFKIALQTDNKILASGTAMINGKPNGIVIRYTENGLIDTTFSGDGYTSLDIGTTNTLGWEVALNGNQEILFSGTFNNGSDTNLFLAKLDNTGDLVTTFGTNGVATSDFNGVDTYRGELALDLLNRAIITGARNSQIYVARYDAFGVLDTNFEPGGLLSIPVGTDSVGRDILVQPHDQKVVVLGQSSEGIVLARLDENLSTLYLPFVVR